MLTSPRSADHQPSHPARQTHLHGVSHGAAGARGLRLPVTDVTARSDRRGYDETHSINGTAAVNAHS